MFSQPTIFTDPSYRFHQAVVLETLYPSRVRIWVGRITGALLIFHLLYMVIPYTLHNMAHVPLPSFIPVGSQGAVQEQADKALDIAKTTAVPESVTLPGIIPVVGGAAVPLDPSTPKGNALFLMVLAVWLVNRMLGWYRNSFYYHVEALLERGETGSKTPYSTPNYEVCAIYWHTAHGDLTKSFAVSTYGRRILNRLGVADETMSQFLGKRTNVVDFGKLEHILRNVFTLSDLVKTLVANDPDLYQFLFEIGIRERELAGGAEWVERDLKRAKQHERWWGKVRLGQQTSVGADFAYGGAYVLGKYGTDLSKKALSGGSTFRYIYGNEQIGQLETILARSKEANAILVGEEGSGKMDVILDFARDIMNGYTNPALKHKRVMAFDTKSLIANMRTKQELETELIRVFNDTVYAGNIILVIEDMPGFIQGGLALDSEVVPLLDPFLRGSTLQVIATADNARFHQFIEPNNAIMQRFEKVMLTEPAEEAMIRILEEAAERTERRSGVFFTYPSLVEILKSAESYFSDGIMPDKALDLLDEIAPWFKGRGGYLLKKLDVLDFIHEKTNIPVGNISDDERDRLMRLEELLKALVIGQEKALEVVANAMRRSRAGVRNPNRPIGTFLFLGPTGVGKTETAKALATVFFGNENAMSRIDMSEYQGDDGLGRMIGTMEGGTGTLPVILKEQPYGVVLLDEFEKTNPKVLDLFLQILDEGIFHDAHGKKVNARNTIFIATSNAGAADIREAMHSGEDLEATQKGIVDKIIAAGKLKPELLNRFDGVILFHPLTDADYRKIAELMLKKLAKRLREKSINLVINEPLIAAVLAHGVDPDFGARPMVRAIQDVVEQKVAEKIISGKLEQGSTVTFSMEDFPELTNIPQ